jgi:superfamily II DNA or RNA helicase
MPGEFIVILSLHRKLGYLLLPYIIERKPGQTFFQLNEIVTPENINKQTITLTTPEQNLVKIISEYSEKNIYKLFSKKKSLKEFYDTVDDDLVNKQIRPYIEKRIARCYEIISEKNFKVFKKEKKYQVVHDEEQIIVVSEPMQPVFNFIKSENDFKYFLSISLKDSDIKLFNQPYIFLSQKPCIVLLNSNLYYVDNIDSKKLIPFFTKDLITIPKAHEREYMDTFVKNAILNYSVKATGFKIIDAKSEHNATLTLEADLKNEPVLILKFVYGPVSFPYNSSEDSSVLLDEQNGNYSYYKYMRNPEWEQSVLEKMKVFGLSNTYGAAFQIESSGGELLNSFVEVVSWLNFSSDSLRNAGFEIYKSKTDKDYYINTINLDIKVIDTNDWFDVKAVVKIGEFLIPFVKFRKHIIMGIREFTLPDNQVVILPAEWFSRYREVFIFGNEENEQLKLRKHHFRVLQEAVGPGTIDILLNLQNKFDLSKKDDSIIPENLEGTLREYQKTGLYWMYQLYRNNFGGCLADDMGLGKTLQTIALLLLVNKDTKNIPAIPIDSKATQQLSLFDIPAFTGGKPLNTSLIIMPVSLIHNWEKEISRFAPTLKVYTFFGTQRTRNFDDLLTVDVVLASYGVVRNDIESLRNLNFKYIILDESQIIKNPDSKIYKAIIQLQSEFKLVLTGTPIENSLTDLWAQLNFLNHDLLKNQHYFREEFVVPIEKHNDEEKKRKLQIIINPFILRRKKEEVVKELPLLTEQILYCDMTEEQQKIYETEKSSVRNMIYESIENKGFEKSSILILKALNKLRLLANHPVLTEPGYDSDSGKFEEILRGIDNIVQERHKVLVFSSYVKHLNLVAEAIGQQNIEYTMLTGASVNRQNIIEKFQKEENIRVFLISLKAGGTGLNLTAADYVFLLDPWWNPAAENQAISRAHRIGQEKKVFVYRYISRDTIEEKIQLLQQKKSAIADIFINNNNPFRSFKKEEIEDLFK